MTVFNRRFFVSCSRPDVLSMRGASVTEVLLAMAIVAMAAPFVYRQMSQINRTVRDVAIARQIIEHRDAVLNFVRMNQDMWPDVVKIKLSDEELASISDVPTVAFVDKYSTTGTTVTDVFLGFDTGLDVLRNGSIVRHIGSDAAIVSDDGVAYGDTWAVSAPELLPGNLVYRVSYDFVGQDRSKYLHRGTSGDDGLNIMLRDLDMGMHNVFGVGTSVAKSAKMFNTTSAFLDTQELLASNVYFSSGANVEGSDFYIGDMRVTGDVTGFRNLVANSLNGSGYTTKGRVITDRATISNSVNVSGDFVLKSDTSRTVSGFTGITANSVATPFISAQEIMFYDNFGLTVSGELLMSTTSPLKIGDWRFPSTRPPFFNNFKLSRGATLSVPSASEFNKIISAGWQSTDVVVLK